MVLREGTTGALPRQPIESVDKAFRLLEMFRSHGHLTVSQASAELGVARSTAHRLLAMLQYHGFARQDPGTRAYVPGGALLEIALGALGSLEVRTVARPELEALSREVHETVHLVILEPPRTRVLDAVESTEALHVRARTGGSLPAHCTSTGKALLAQLAPERVRRIVGDEPLEQLTPRSIATIAELESELRQVRERGYATNFSENEADIVAFAVAIPVPAGTTPAALGVLAPATRLPPELVPDVAQAAIAAARRVGSRLEGRS